MALRDLQVRTKGSLLGLLWIALIPLIQTAVYVFIILFIFKSKLPGFDTSIDYIAYVLCGQVAWSFISKTMNDAPMLIRSRMELVKQVIYPVETLPANSIILGAISVIITFVIAIGVGLYAGNISLTIFLMPLPIILLTLFALGSSWLLMIIGVIFKDISEVITLFFGLLVYLSPVLLFEGLVSETLWTLILLNPFSHIIIVFRDVIFGEFHMMSWFVFSIMSVVSSIVGYYLLSRFRLIINEHI
ncbi:ABC transporter permease [Candidatus Terasakiella magnetica]|nr:ABC transporter permease [Candidatus Terasakiella magnetica]